MSFRFKYNAFCKKSLPVASVGRSRRNPVNENVRLDQQNPLVVQVIRHFRQRGVRERRTNEEPSNRKGREMSAGATSADFESSHSPSFKLFVHVQWDDGPVFHVLDHMDTGQMDTPFEPIVSRPLASVRHVLAAGHLVLAYGSGHLPISSSSWTPTVV